MLNHQKVNFELWLLGQTRDVQICFWQKLKGVEWVNKEVMPEYSIFETTLLDAPDFDNSTILLEAIKSQFEQLSQKIFTILEAYE